MSDEKKLKEKDLDNVNGGFTLIDFKNSANDAKINDEPSSAVDPGSSDMPLQNPR